MHPKPVSDVKALCARFCTRTMKLIADVALRSELLCIGEKPERYVIHMRDSKSSRKSCGQPPYCRGSTPLAASFRCASSKLVRIQLSSSVAPARSVCGVGEGEAAGGVLAASPDAGFEGGGSLGSYCCPKHHIGELPSLLGSGSYRVRRRWRPTRSMSFMAVAARCGQAEGRGRDVSVVAQGGQKPRLVMDHGQQSDSRSWQRRTDGRGWMLKAVVKQRHVEAEVMVIRGEA
jgi:hypothetical protein